MFRPSRFGMIAALVVVLALGASRAGAQTRLFAIVGAGVGPTGLPLPMQPPRAHWAVGIATDLGPYAGLGSVQTDSATFNADGTITGNFSSGSPFVFVGANGDKLVCDYGHVATNPGTFTLTPVANAPGYFTAAWIAEFVPTSASTGKFKDVRGSWTMYAFSEPFLLGSNEPVGYWWVGAGRLTFKKK